MNILFITPSYKPAYHYGGTIVTIAILAESLVTLGHRVTVLTTTANGKQELAVKQGIPEWMAGVEVIYFKRITGDHTHASPALWKYVYRNAKQYDVVHIHSWWNILVVVALWICVRQGIRPVLSPHGMFSNYILTANHRWKKKLLQHLVGKKLLRRTCLHVSTPMEWEESHRAVPHWKGKIIPNPFYLPQNKHNKRAQPIFTIGFLSRLDPKKGVDLLITALSQVSFPYRLKIAGSGDAAYTEYLKSLSVSLGNQDFIEWVGWMSGEAKFEFLSQMDLFALISHSENFAIVVVESLAVGTPVVISNGVGLCRYVEEKGLGWVVEANAAQVAETLEAVFRDRSRLESASARSAGIIARDFDCLHLASQYVQLYTNQMETHG